MKWMILCLLSFGFSQKKALALLRKHEIKQKTINQSNHDLD